MGSEYENSSRGVSPATAKDRYTLRATTALHFVSLCRPDHGRLQTYDSASVAAMSRDVLSIRDMWNEVAVVAGRGDTAHTSGACLTYAHIRVNMNGSVRYSVSYLA